MTAADESFLRLHRSGWSIGEIAGWTPEGPYWQVWGHQGENIIRAEGEPRKRRGGTRRCRRLEWGCWSGEPLWPEL
jgi:hypothetical protein